MRYLMPALLATLALATNALAQTCPAPLVANAAVGHNQPQAADNNFAPDFQPPFDSQWGFTLGGFGGGSGCPKNSSGGCATVTHRPIIFVHGNTRDARDWTDPITDCYGILDSGGQIPQYFKQHFNYLDWELWGLSYNGKSVDLCSSGSAGNPHAGNEVNVPKLFAFVNAVIKYVYGPVPPANTKVDIVAHSLGVTIVRRMFQAHPGILPSIDRFVAIDGANHGTSICRTQENIYYGCDEIAPGSYWLNQLNECSPSTLPQCLPAVLPGTGEADICQGKNETFGVPTLVIHDSMSNGTDIFFEQTDVRSPILAGAVSCNFPGLTHDQLRYETVPTYADYLELVDPAGFLTAHPQCEHD